MKALFIGGTGIISTAISKKLLEEGHELWLINRGSRNYELPEGAHIITADIEDEGYVAKALEGQQFDTVTDFIAYRPEQLERDYRLFKGKTKQFIYISSASVYQKPLPTYKVTESTSIRNPYWEYASNKVDGEVMMMKLYREEGFPVTIVRPGHTYCERKIPLGVQGKKGFYQTVKRMLEGKPIIVHGDGSSLWTMTSSKDFAKGFIGLMGNIHAIGETVQITSDETLTWNQIHQAIADALGVPYKPYYVATEFLTRCGAHVLDAGGLTGDKAHSIVYDNTKIKRLVPGYTATIRFDQGIRETVQYVLTHPEAQIEDPEFDAWCDRVIEAQEEAMRKVKGETV